MEEKSKGIIVPESIITNEESRTTDIIVEKKIFPYGLVISIILSAISVAIFTWLIFSFVDPTEVSSESCTQEIYLENFFIRLIFTEEALPGIWIKPIIEYKLGFYFLVPIAMISFAISGLTFLVKGYKKTRLLIFFNWAIYLVPIISSILVNEYNNSIPWFGLIHVDTTPTTIFGIYFWINILLQISLLTFEEDFYQWILSPKGPNNIDSANNPRVIIFILFYLVAWLSPIILMINIQYAVTFIAIFGLGLALLLIWWCVSDSIRLIILMNKNTEGLRKNVQLTLSAISAVLGISVIMIYGLILLSLTNYTPILYTINFSFLIIGVGFGALSSKSLTGKIGYVLNTLGLLAFIIIPLIVIFAMMGWENLFV